MERAKCSQLLGYFIILAGLAVMFGWIFDIRWLIQPGSSWVSMKFITAICFVLSGIMLVLISRLKLESANFEFLQTILPILSLLILLILAESFLPLIFGFAPGIENMLLVEKPGEVYSISPGLPAFPTMLNFALIALIGLLKTVNGTNRSIWTILMSYTLIIISVVALIGYVLNIPWLFYYVPKKSTAIAFTTAILFIIWGIGMIISEGKNG